MAAIADIAKPVLLNDPSIISASSSLEKRKPGAGELSVDEKKCQSKDKKNDKKQHLKKSDIQETRAEPSSTRQEENGVVQRGIKQRKPKKKKNSKGGIGDDVEQNAAAARIKQHHGNDQKPQRKKQQLEEKRGKTSHVKLLSVDELLSAVQEQGESVMNSGVQEEKLLEKQTQAIPDYTPEMRQMIEQMKHLPASHTAKDLAELEEDFIFKLRKKSLKFPDAQFFCRICEYHCNSVSVCRKHMKDSRHQRRKSLRTAEMMLRSLPPPSGAHAIALTSLLEIVVADYGISENELQQRNTVFETIQKKVSEKLPGVHLELYGSSLTGMGLKQSDINIDVSMGTSPLILKDVYQILKKDESGYLEGVVSDFSAKVPNMKAFIPSAGCICTIGVSNGPSCETSKLLNYYVKLDPRVRPLAIAFRQWARICRVDSQPAGTLPAYVFPLLTVYFLQQCKNPVLPVLHEINVSSRRQINSNGENTYFTDLENLTKHWCCKNKDNLGQLWLKMLKFYSVDFQYSVNVVSIRELVPLARQKKKWNSKKLAIEDPFQVKRNVARCLNHVLLFEYLLERLGAAYLYFAVPRSHAGPLSKDEDLSQYHCMLRDKMRELQLESERDPGDQKNEKHQNSELCKTVTGGLAKEPETECKDRQVDIKDDHKVTVTIQQNKQNETIKQCTTNRADNTFLEALGIVGIKGDRNKKRETCVSADDKALAEHVDSDVPEAVENADVQDCSSVGRFATDLVQSILYGVLERLVRSEADDNEASEPMHSESECDGKESVETSTITPHSILDKGDVSDSISVAADSPASHSSTAEQSAKPHESKLPYNAADLVFKFDAGSLADEKGPAVVCNICQCEGHLKSSCPEERLPALCPLPPMTQPYRNLLCKVLMKVPADFQPSKWELKARQGVVIETQDHVSAIYPNARLSLFGSSCNGFGFQNSDLDICMTLEGEDQKNLNFSEIIEKLAGVLKKQKGFYQVVPICSAKVPIVKFRHGRSQLEGDISLYNILAQQNTRMLLAYSMIDYRVKIIGYTIKVYAKLCDICDASRGSLSSYAYTLMMIYYLQQRDPPVIPVLQELHKGEKPKHTVDGWNSWFMDDMDKLPKLWDGYGKNNESVSDLWIGLLNFYSHEFNFNDFVISIRQKEPLTKFERLWNGKCIAIEDPFDLSHNLGAGLSRKMNIYIQRAFRCGRMLFGTPVTGPPPGYQSIQDYLFNPKLCTEGELPNDRGCRICSKIGHIAKECPVVKARKEREEKDREEKRRRQEHQRMAQQSPGQQHHTNNAARHNSPSKQGPPQNRQHTPDRHTRESTPLHIPVRHSPHQQQYDRHHTPGGSPASRSMATPPKQRNRSHGSPHPQQQSPVTPQVYYSNQLDPQLMQWPGISLSPPVHQQTWQQTQWLQSRSPQSYQGSPKASSSPNQYSGQQHNGSPQDRPRYL